MYPILREVYEISKDGFALTNVRRLKKINKHTRGHNRQIDIACPYCAQQAQVKMFNWQTKTCKQCQNVVNKYDWYLWDEFVPFSNGLTDICFVCDKTLDLMVDSVLTYHIPQDNEKYILDRTDKTIRWINRCLWHGLHGTENTVYGLKRGGLAKSLEEAQERALEQLSSPYVAPELQEKEQEILDEVKRLLALENETKEPISSDN